MSFEPVAVFTRLVDHAAKLGRFDRVNIHEPKNAPGKGLTCAIWADRIDTITSSGLSSTSVRVSFKTRIYTSMIQEPQDGIDPAVLEATCALFAAYNGDFELDALARMIDVLGSENDHLYAEAGYLEIGGRMHRVMTINVPIVFNDAFDQSP